MSVQYWVLDPAGVKVCIGGELSEFCLFVFFGFERWVIWDISMWKRS
jgi:hypothetical protein